MIDNILKQAMNLPIVSPTAAKEYKEKMSSFVANVNKAMSEDPACEMLIGETPIEMMYDNHGHHANFMSNVFQLGLHEIMVKVVVWVYSSYHARGYTFDYFKAALPRWKQAVEENLNPSHSQEINVIYNWLIERHEEFIILAREAVNPEYEIEMELQKTRLFFTQHLLEGDSQACLKLAKDFLHDKENVKKFYLHIIQPVMYEIGYGWERGRISIAQEHLASAIIARVMSTFYQNFIVEKTNKHKVAIVTAAPNEFHEIGAHMVADFLEMDGWNVYFLGANTPAEDLTSMIEDKKPIVLAISVTMPFNLKHVKETIDLLRRKLTDSNIKIMAGGISCNMESKLWEKIGADGWATNAEEAVVLAQEWYEQAAEKYV